jgi:hypothetical protein
MKKGEETTTRVGLLKERIVLVVVKTRACEYKQA